MLSDNIKKGVERAPNRSLLFALGLTEEEIAVMDKILASMRQRAGAWVEEN